MRTPPCWKAPTTRWRWSTSAPSGAPEGGTASASYLRQLLRQGQGEAACGFTPPEAADILRRELSHGRVTDSALCERSVLSRLRVMTEEDWRGYDPGGEGLYHRLYQAARSACTVDGLLSAAKTKRYPLARLRRMALAAYLQLPPAPAQVPYIRVLAATAAGRAHLRRLRDAGAPVLTKPADVSSLGADAAALFALEGRCTDLYVLARPDLTQSAPGQDYRTTPVMV